MAKSYLQKKFKKKKEEVILVTEQETGVMYIKHTGNFTGWLIVPALKH